MFAYLLLRLFFDDVGFRDLIGSGRDSVGRGGGGGTVRSTVLAVVCAWGV